MSSIDQTRDRFAELWTDYLEGELCDDGLAELRELLAKEDDLVKSAADSFQIHRMLGLVAEETPQRQESFVAETMKLLPTTNDEFVDSVMSHVLESSVALRKPDGRRRRRWTSPLGWAAAALLLIGAVMYHSRPAERQQSLGNVRLANVANAKFFGELSPTVGSLLTQDREYVLMDGLVQVTFPAGASAILEGPAVFRVTSNESLALDAGRCSVHAPDGAQGFRIDTPETRVIDRGTRFSVNVSENSATEVFVKEGVADVYEQSGAIDPESELGPGTRLTQGDARRFASAGAFGSEWLDADSPRYRDQLPDRMMSYETAAGAQGGAERLVSVTTQRGGRRITTPITDLIPASVSWFKASTSPASLCGAKELPSSRVDALRDTSLVTGVINPGGSEEPLTVDPILQGDRGTPGMAIHFDRPVSNGPGADVVFFDLQTFVNPMDGDPFHVSPLAFRDGLRSHTIRHYDLTMESPEAQLLTNFHVHFFETPVSSVVELQSLETIPRVQTMRYRGLAVGIDLSDLGYSEGETVAGLFIQDALDDQHFVDPVFVAGLPEVN